MHSTSQLSALFRDYVNQNVRSVNQNVRYGIEVQEAAPDLSMMVLRLTFLSPNIYCCAEPHCHLGTDLSALRELASRRGIHLPPNCVVHIHGVVERGAQLKYGESEPPKASEAYEYHADLFDGCCGMEEKVEDE